MPPTDQEETYEVHARALSPGNVESWVGDYNNPTQDGPEWLEEVMSGLTNAVIGWPDGDPMDLPYHLIATVKVSEE